MALIDLTPTPEEELHLMEMLQPDYRLSNDSRVITATESEKIPNQKESKG